MGDGPFAAACSQHPRPQDAAGEVIGEVIEAVGAAPDLAVVFVSPHHVDAAGDIAGAVRALLAPTTLLGATAVSIVGGAREIENEPAVALWAGRVGPVEPVRLEAHQAGGGWAVRGLPTDAAEAPRTLLLLADPFSFPADGLLDQLATSAPRLAIIGGLASAANGPGGNRLLLDDGVHRDGAVGVLLPGDGSVRAVVSQGCRPIGEPFVVTKAEGNLVEELGGRPALVRLEELLAALGPDERELARRGLHAGLVIDEHRAEFDRGDFLVRNLLGADPERGAVAVGDLVDVGTTLQFQVRDAASADEDLRALLAGQEADAALLFTCNGRGTHLFGQPHHDASLVAATAGAGSTAGMFCAGELGPVGGRNHLHGFTASVALFGGR